MRDYTKDIAWITAEDPRLTVYIHNKCDEKDLNSMLFGMGLEKPDVYKDDLAHIIAAGHHTVAYRIRNTIYMIPATIKAVVNNNDGKLNCYFEYPCEMKWEDLIKYDYKN